MPRVGERAPSFRLPDQDGVERSLEELLTNKRFLVLYFYPRDNTPGCTAEACSFRDALPDLRDGEVEVVGISTDPPEAHRRFREKYGLTFTLLSDVEGRVARMYGAFREERGTCARKTYIIDSSGVVRAVFEKVKPDGHALEVLDTVRKL